MVIGRLTVLAKAAFTIIHRFWFSVTMLWTLGTGVLAGRVGMSNAGRGLGTLGAVLGDPPFTSADFLGGLVVGILAGGLVRVITSTAMMFGQIRHR